MQSAGKHKKHNIAVGLCTDCVTRTMGVMPSVGDVVKPQVGVWLINYTEKMTRVSTRVFSWIVHG